MTTTAINANIRSNVAEQYFDADSIEKNLMSGKRVAATEAEFILSYGIESEPVEQFTVNRIREIVRKSQEEIANGNVHTNNEMKTYFRTLIDSL